MTLDPDERELFVKGLQHATATASGPALDAALIDMGWADALALDPRIAVGGLFEAQGRAGATSRGLDAVLADALGVEPGVFVVPAMGRGLVLGGLDDLDRVYVADGDTVRAVDVAALTVRAVRGIDPGLELVEISDGGGPVLAPAGVAAARRAVGHELVGASRAMLELAREHALDRVQFGQPIAAFQAIRHKLAETLVAIEGAAGALDAAWDEGTPFSAMVAKGIAGKSARVAAKHCQQVLAGVGFTEEHAFHGYLRRTRVLDQLFGDSRTLTRELGAHLLEQRAVPPILPL